MATLSRSSGVALVAALLAARATATADTCTKPKTSCESTAAASCCFSSPGGLFTQTQFWDTDPVTGPDNSWTIHGLWPNNCDGTYSENCDSSRDYTDITSLMTEFGYSSTLTYMQEYWQSNSESDEAFWEHEWSTHGTCVNTIQPSCYTNYKTGEEAADYFNTVVNLFKTLPTYTWLSDAGITPSTSKTYTSSQIQSALKSKFGYDVALLCSSGELYQIYYYFNVEGNLITGDFIPTAPVGSGSNCPSSGIKYLPKSGGSSGSSGNFSGTGYLEAYTGGSNKGCLISAGTWYVGGTCATYTATASGSGFTLKSSKGNCAVSGGAITCGSGVTATTFTSVNGLLASDNQTTFYADAIPSGSIQEKVYTASDSVAVTFQWKNT